MTGGKEKKSGGANWAGLGFLLLAAVFIVTGAVLTLRAISCTEKVVDKPTEALDSAAELARAFKTGTIKTEFFSYATRVRGEPRLQVVEVGQIEVFRRKDSKAYFWDLLKLPDVEVEIRVPVTYTYYIELGDEWRFDLEGKTLTVTVPPMKAGTPAPDISNMETREKKSLLRLDEEDVKKKLMEGITKELEKRAVEHVESLDLRATAKKSVRKFVGPWFSGVLKSHGVQQPAGYRIEVRFHGAEAKTTRIEPLP